MSSSYKWDSKNTVFVGLKLNSRTDADIIEYLNAVPNKQGFIKDLIRQAAAEAKKDNP